MKHTHTETGSENCENFYSFLIHTEQAPHIWTERMRNNTAIMNAKMDGQLAKVVMITNCSNLLLLLPNYPPKNRRAILQGLTLPHLLIPSSWQMSLSRCWNPQQLFLNKSMLGIHRKTIKQLVLPPSSWFDVLSLSFSMRFELTWSADTINFCADVSVCSSSASRVAISKSESAKPIWWCTGMVAMSFAIAFKSKEKYLLDATWSWTASSHSRSAFNRRRVSEPPVKDQQDKADEAVTLALASGINEPALWSTSLKSSPVMAFSWSLSSSADGISYLVQLLETFRLAYFGSKGEEDSPSSVFVRTGLLVLGLVASSVPVAFSCCCFGWCFFFLSGLMIPTL